MLNMIRAVGVVVAAPVMILLASLVDRAWDEGHDYYDFDEYDEGYFDAAGQLPKTPHPTDASSRVVSHTGRL